MKASQLRAIQHVLVSSAIDHKHLSHARVRLADYVSSALHTHRHKSRDITVEYELKTSFMVCSSSAAIMSLSLMTWYLDTEGRKMQKEQGQVCTPSHKINNKPYSMHQRT